MNCIMGFELGTTLRKPIWCGLKLGLKVDTFLALMGLGDGLVAEPDVWVM